MKTKLDCTAFRMKLASLALMTVVMVSAMMAGCASLGGSASGNGTGNTAPSQQQLTPQQVVAIVCPPLQSALTQLQGIYATQAAMGSVSAAKAVDGLNKAAPIVAGACTVGASVSTANVQAFVSTALPALAQAAGTLPLSQKELQDVQTALLTAQVALGVYNVVQSQLAAGASSSTTAPASASSVAK